MDFTIEVPCSYRSSDITYLKSLSSDVGDHLGFVLATPPGVGYFHGSGGCLYAEMRPRSADVVVASMTAEARGVVITISP